MENKGDKVLQDLLTKALKDLPNMSSLDKISNIFGAKDEKEFITMIKNNIKIILSGLQQTHYPVSYPEQINVLHSYMRLINV